MIGGDVAAGIEHVGVARLWSEVRPCKRTSSSPIGWLARRLWRAVSGFSGPTVFRLLCRVVQQSGGAGVDVVAGLGDYVVDESVNPSCGEVG
jgi:hypothetical protein